MDRSQSVWRVAIVVELHSELSPRLDTLRLVPAICEIQTKATSELIAGPVSTSRTVSKADGMAPGSDLNNNPQVYGTCYFGVVDGDSEDRIVRPASV
jgi:hypothetical protein